MLINRQVLLQYSSYHGDYHGDEWPACCDSKLRQVYRKDSFAGT